jgi:hypothetical protein
MNKPKRAAKVLKSAESANVKLESFICVDSKLSPIRKAIFNHKGTKNTKLH